MKKKTCPICGKVAMTRRRGTYRFDFPSGFPVDHVIIPKAEWDSCEACGEEILSQDLEARIEHERYRLQGLLSPGEMRAIRERTGLTQAQMAKLLSVGGKSYTRWESGRSIQTKSMDNLIRLAGEHPEVLYHLEAQRDPERLKLVKEYLAHLAEQKSDQELPVAAHGGLDSIKDRQRIRSRLIGLLEDRRE